MARNSSDIQAPGSHPFHLQAQFRAAYPGEASGEGTYDCIWADLHKWREEITLGKFHMVRTRDGESLYLQPNYDYIPTNVRWMLDHVLPGWEYRYSSPGPHLDWTIDQRPDGSVALTLPSNVAPEAAQADLVFNPTTRQLTRFSGGNYSHFQSFLGKQVALSGSGSAVIPMDSAGNAADEAFAIRKLEAIPTPAASTFILEGAFKRVLPERLEFHHPEIIHAEAPDFPESASKKHISGDVILAAGIDEKGEPREVRVLRSLNLTLDAEAVKAVRRYLFKPAQVAGFPVSSQMTITVPFNSD